MKHTMITLALTGALTLSLLAGCSNGRAPSPTPDTTLPPITTPSPEVSSIPSATPAPLPSEPPLLETEAPSESPSAPPSPAPSSPSKPSASPAPTPAPTPVPMPTPSPLPSVTPEPQSSVVQDIWDEISAFELPSLADVDAGTLSALYGIDSGDLVEYLCKVPLMNVQATEFFIAQVAEGKMDTVKSAVEARQAALEEQWSTYLPDQLALVQNYQLVINGDYLLFAVSEQADAAVSAFDTYTK